MSISRSLYEKDLYPDVLALDETNENREILRYLEKSVSDGQISRRSFLMGATAIAAVGATQVVDAASGEIVFANWGGPARDLYKEVYGLPFERASGLNVVIDGSGPLPSKVKSMIDTNSVIWDIIDADAGKALVLAREGLLEPIDYNIVDRSKVALGDAYEHFVAGYYLSNALTYDSAKLPKAPTGWKDFWDVDQFPGMRCVRKQPDANIEMCMIAAGRAKDDVYPIDFDLVKSKLRELKSNLITWSSGSQSQEMFLNGEVVMGNLWTTRTNLLHRETQGRIKWTWNESILLTCGWAVPRGNPAGREAAMKFIASMQDPQQQIQILGEMGNGPANPAAAAMVPDDLKIYDPNQPAHKEVAIIHNPRWYDDPSGIRNLTNDALAREIWLDVLS